MVGRGNEKPPVSDTLCEDKFLMGPPQSSESHLVYLPFSLSLSVSSLHKRDVLLLCQFASF